MNKAKVLVLGLGTLLLLGIVFLGPLRFLDNVFYDLNFAFSPSPATDSVIVVGIDVKSIGKIGSWPWPRGTTARLVNAINACEPRAVSLDMLFPRGHDEGADDSLADAFASAPNLVLPFRAGAASKDHTDEELEVPDEVYSNRFFLLQNQDALDNAFFFKVSQFAALDPLFSQHTDYSGFVNVTTSNTSQKLREAIHVMQAGSEYYPSFAVASVAAYMGLSRDQIILDGDGPKVHLGGRVVPLSTYAASVYINYRSDDRPVTVISASDVLEGKVAPERITGRLVFIGITDAAAGADFFTTPVRSQFPGVEVWATAAMDILEGAWVTWGGGLNQAFNWLVVLLLFPGLAIAIPGKHKIIAIAGGLLLLGGSIAASVVLFGQQSYFWNPANHLYAWVFSLLWLAAQKVNPVLGESTAPLMMAPPSTDEHDMRPPPTQEQYLRAIPRNDTSAFVMRTLVPDMVAGQPVKITPQLFEQFRTLSGGTIIQTLGSGGMADVYLIWNPRLEVYRAVKVIKPGQNPQLMERFETEIRIFSKLNHPNIVVCYGVGEWHTLPTVEMEYVNGVALEDVLKIGMRLTTAQALAVSLLTCRALHFAHNQVFTIYGKTYHGVIHRDIKPANILLNRSGQIKLTDFGIARPGETSIHTGDAGHVVGTLPYLAPEQLDEGADLTARTDLYALGATIYEFLHGARAFPQRDVTSLIKAKTFGSVPPLKPSEDVPQMLVDTVNKVMSIEPTDRHESGEDLAKDLEKVMRQMDIGDGYTHLKQLVNDYYTRRSETA